MQMVLKDVSTIRLSSLNINVYSGQLAGIVETNCRAEKGQWYSDCQKRKEEKEEKACVVISTSGIEISTLEIHHKLNCCSILDF